MEKDDRILDLAIHYALNNNYPETEELTKYQKRAVRKRAATLLVEKGEVYLEKKERKVKVISSVQEQQRILKACHSEATSGHFGVTKTHKRIAERFYWKGIVADVRKLVSSVLYNLQAGCQKQSDCVRLAKYRQNTLPGILRLIMFTNISILTGATLSRVPAYEQEDRERETRAESNPGEVTLVSSWYRFHRSHFPTFICWKPVHSNCIGLFHEVCLGSRTTNEGSCGCSCSPSAGEIYI